MNRAGSHNPKRDARPCSTDACGGDIDSQVIADQVIDDLDRRRKAGQRRYYARRPKAIRDVMAALVQRRGFAQIQVAEQLAEAWKKAAGSQLASRTRLGEIRRGTLHITVANSLLMQELGFRNEEILNNIRQSLPDAGIERLRFRVGQVKS